MKKKKNIPSAEFNFELTTKMKAEAFIKLGDGIAKMISPQAAETCYRQAIQLAPELFQAWKKLGFCRAEAGSVDEQLECLKSAVYHSNEAPESIYNLGRRLEKLNRLSDLDEIVRKYKRRFADNPWILALEAIDLWRKGRMEQARITALRCLARNPVDKLKQYVYWLLGTLLDRLARYREAYQYFEYMNRLSAKRAEPGLKERFHELITKQKLSVQNLSADCFRPCFERNTDTGDKGPIFITGFPRSGTTLMGRLLHSHPELVTRDEWDGIRTAIKVMESRGLTYPECIAELTKEVIREMRTQYREKMKMEGRSEKYVDKLPLNLAHLGLILKLFPRARILIMVRNPFDACLSGFFQNFNLNSAMLNFLTLEKTARFYDHIMSLTKRYLENTPDSIYCIRYEDLTANVQQTTKSLFDFLEVPWSSQILQFHEHAKQALDVRTPSYHQIVKPIYSHSVERWRGYREFLEPVSKWLDPWCRYFNYPAMADGDCRNSRKLEPV